MFPGLDSLSSALATLDDSWDTLPDVAGPHQSLSARSVARIIFPMSARVTQMREAAYLRSMPSKNTCVRCLSHIFKQIQSAGGSADAVKIDLCCFLPDDPDDRCLQSYEGLLKDGTVDQTSVAEISRCFRCYKMGAQCHMVSGLLRARQALLGLVGPLGVLCGLIWLQVPRALLADVKTLMEMVITSTTMAGTSTHTLRNLQEGSGKDFLDKLDEVLNSLAR